MTWDPRLEPLLDRAVAGRGPLVFLTGAGISAGQIPTFRGPDGWWTVGSKNYRAEELATLEAFRFMPDEIWSWYLYRRAICRAAVPNAAHLALVHLESMIGERFLLITQNVDGLHPRAGSKRLFEIHGNLDLVRCAKDCNPQIFPLPSTIDVSWQKGRELVASERERLRCPDCGSWLRPHVLWFDESYDEEHFRFQSSLFAANRADLLVVIGTSGSTTLPNLVAELVSARGSAVIACNPEETPLTDLAQKNPSGLFWPGTAIEQVPRICTAIVERVTSAQRA